MHCPVGMCVVSRQIQIVDITTGLSKEEEEEQNSLLARAARK
jgi:hypothetical protein